MKATGLDPRRRRRRERAPVGVTLAAIAVLLFLHLPMAVVVLYCFTTDNATLSFPINADPPLDCVLAGPRDTTTIDSVTLLVDGDFPTPTARRSWGHLKTIYR